MPGYPTSRHDLAAVMAQRQQQAQGQRAAAMPAPAARPTDPATGGFLPPPQRQGDALSQMYARRPGGPSPQMQAAIQAQAGNNGNPVSGGPRGGAPPASFAGFGGKGAGQPPPNAAPGGPALKGAPPPGMGGPPPPGGMPAGNKGSAAAMGPSMGGGY